MLSTMEREKKPNLVANFLALIMPQSIPIGPIETLF